VPMIWAKRHPFRMIRRPAAAGSPRKTGQAQDCVGRGAAGFTSHAAACPLQHQPSAGSWGVLKGLARPWFGSLPAEWREPVAQVVVLRSGATPTDLTR